MRLKIKTGHLHLYVILPTCLVLNRLALAIALRALRPYVTLPPENQPALLHQLRQLRRQCRHLTLVEVHTAAGEEILLRL